MNLSHEPTILPFLGGPRAWICRFYLGGVHTIDRYSTDTAPQSRLRSEALCLTPVYLTVCFRERMTERQVDI